MCALPSNTKKSMLTVPFHETVHPETAFSLLFRTIPLRRFNNCTFERKTSYDARGGYRICVISADQPLLESMRNVLEHAPAFMAHIAAPELSVSAGVTSDSPIAQVVQYKLKTAKGETPTVQAGADLAVTQHAIASEAVFPPQPCAKCGQDTEGMLRCPHCKKLQRQLSTIGWIYLIVMIGLSVYQIAGGFDMAWLTNPDPLVRVSLVVVALEIICLFVAAGLLIRFRKMGFWVLVGLKMFDVLLGVLIGGQSLVSVALGPILFVFFAYLFLSRDLPYME